MRLTIWSVRSVAQPRQTRRMHAYIPKAPALTVVNIRKRPLRRLSHAKSQLSDANDIWNSMGTLVIIGNLLAALGYSALPLFSRKQQPDASLDPGDISDEDVKWTVMGIISCLPFVNWLSWVFAAIDDPAKAVRYYLFAALYLAPYLAEGITLDSVVLGATFLSAVHVQVERQCAQQDQLLSRGADAEQMDAADQPVKQAQQQLPTGEQQSVQEWAATDEQGSRLQDPRTRDEYTSVTQQELRKFDELLGKRAGQRAGKSSSDGGN